MIDDWFWPVLHCYHHEGVFIPSCYGSAAGAECCCDPDAWLPADSDEAIAQEEWEAAVLFAAAPDAEVVELFAGGDAT